jgi:ferric-dicitrate binding protein FerR (iron transport regulator)
MAENLSRLEYLYKAFLNNTASSVETWELFRLIEDLDNDHPIREMIMKEYGKKIPDKPADPVNWDNALQKIFRNEPETALAPVLAHRSSGKRWLYAAAVAVVIIVGATGYFFNREEEQKHTLSENIETNYKNDLTPGKSGAMLTLADGRQISLDSIKGGVLAMQGDARLVSTGGVLNYEKMHASNGEVLYNTISTSRGRQFSIVLSDGSRVWLNAASSIRYPVYFNDRDRKVKITGEVYFEIASHYRKDNTKVPFVVQFPTHSGENAEVHVTGTHFNINTYGDNSEEKTTLLEGGITLVTSGQHIVLKPGQQGRIANDGRVELVSSPDIDAVMAWKNGYFSFDNTNIVTLMSEIGRWYDVDIEYAGAVPDRKFGGEISRNSNASQVLRIMEESDVHFRIEGKKIIVLP